MTAPEILETVRNAGGRIEVDGPDLVITAHLPLSVGLMARIREHKPELIEVLRDDRASWADMPLSDLEKMDVAIKIESVYGSLWLVSSKQSECLVDTDDPIYTVAEARRMVNLPEPMVRQIHEFKKVYAGTITSESDAEATP